MTTVRTPLPTDHTVSDDFLDLMILYRKPYSLVKSRIVAYLPPEDFVRIQPDFLWAARNVLQQEDGTPALILTDDVTGLICLRSDDSLIDIQKLTIENLTCYPCEGLEEVVIYCTRDGLRLVIYQLYRGLVQ